jgi:NMD protein affecting ribosome stability and mRNA decay
MTQCPRCAVLEDLLETARIQVEHARREAEKADDEAVAHKAESLRLRASGSRADYALIKEFQRRAEKAEAALAKATGASQ